MSESNIYFSTNTYNYGNEYSGGAKNFFKEPKGNAAFFRKVMDYDALKKLREKMGGSLTSGYYIGNKEQLRVLDPNFMSVMVSYRKKDPKIEEENRRYDEEYGYPKVNSFYPLLDSISVDKEELSYADEMLGKWIALDKKSEGIYENQVGLYIKQAIERDQSIDAVNPIEAGLEDTDDGDPYYYLYEDRPFKERKERENLDKVKLFEEKYGSIFRAFEEVAQEEIIQAPADQYSFVNAGPGTGKTYTLIKKITYLIEEQGVDPEGILVLCFTNAAVNEIKSRIQKHIEEEGDISFINIDVRTFHSFSWLLISQANEIFRDRKNYRYIDLSTLNYEKSINEAIRIIKNYGDEVFGGCEHLIVDEIQDLTNEKASLVITMVKECMKNKVGITVLGDSCQAIYDYTDEDVDYELRSTQFYRRMFAEFIDTGKFYKMEHNHRQSTELINATMPLRQAILDEKKPVIRQTIDILNRHVSEVVKGPLSVKISEQHLKRIAENGTLCLMCRNNAQVLATSTNLRKRMIDHVVNAYDEFEYLSDWIGKVFGLTTKSIISYDEFVSKLSKTCDSVDPEEIWLRLQDVIGSSNNVLAISDILSAIAKSKVDDPAFRNVPRGNIIVSNIHRSKGREYDAVVMERKFIKRLVNESVSIKSVQKYLEEAKTLYVAVTRPRTQLFFNNLATTDVSLKKINSTGRKRWVRGDGSRLKTIEIRALSDADIDSYNTTDIQRYIVKNVAEGDEINLVIDTHSRSIVYHIVHISDKGERVIGRTTDDLTDDIDAIITPYDSPWPNRISDLYVSGIHSQISEDFKSVWCWVDFCGLGMARTEAY